MKLFKNLLLIAAVSCGANSASAQTWMQTSAPSDNWQSVASSADGSNLVAAVAGSKGIYTSTNSGVTWTQTSAPNKIWSSVASSADGNKLAAASLQVVYTSTNSGNSWTSNSVPGTNLISIASSADGSKLAAAVGATPFFSMGSDTSGFIYVSTNSGATWIQSDAPSKVWSSVASSADGTKLVAVTMNYPANASWIYTSTNSGVTWIQANAPTNLNWISVASSVDGSKLAAINLPNYVFVDSNLVFTALGLVYTSTNSGATWFSNNAPNTVWQAVASSADGTKLAALHQGGGIYTSTNSGATWTSNGVAAFPCWAMASSADGNKLVMAVNGGGIWTSQTVPSPQLNLTPSPTNLTLAWTVPSTNFVLQQSSDLTSWADMTNPPVLNLTNLQNEVMLSPSNRSGFYRLKTP